MKKSVAESLKVCLQKKPFSKITVDDIRDTAGVGRCSFHRHFKDKHELLNRLYDFGFCAKEVPVVVRMIVYVRIRSIAAAHNFGLSNSNHTKVYSSLAQVSFCHGEAFSSYSTNPSGLNGEKARKIRLPLECSGQALFFLQSNLIPGVYASFLQYPYKNALRWHDTHSNLLKYLTVMMTFLTDLGNLSKASPDAQYSSYR